MNLLKTLLWEDGYAQFQKYEDELNNPPETIKQERREIMEEWARQKKEFIRQEAVEEFRAGLLEKFKSNLERATPEYCTWYDIWKRWMIVVERYNLPIK